MNYSLSVNQLFLMIIHAFQESTKFYTTTYYFFVPQPAVAQVGQLLMLYSKKKDKY